MTKEDKRIENLMLKMNKSEDPEVIKDLKKQIAFLKQNKTVLK